MTPAEFTAYGKARHGNLWIKPMAKELGFHFSTIWRAARGTKPISREMEQAIQLLPKKRTSTRNPSPTQGE